jgi:hypothetical protein
MIPMAINNQNIDKLLQKYAKAVSTPPSSASGFREEYAKAKTQQERDAIIFNYAIKQPPPETVPMTIPGPNGITYTIQVMKRPFAIDGIPVTPSPPVAQRIAKYFKMELPTFKMADIINRNSNRVPVTPFSSSGVTIDGRQYSGSDVVQNYISDPRFALAYGDKVNAAINERRDLDPTKPISGFQKMIVQPEPGRESRTHYHDSWKNPANMSGQSTGTMRHDLTEQEYLAMLQGVGNSVIVTPPGRKPFSTTLDRILNTRNLSVPLTNNPGSGLVGYLNRQDGPPPGFRSTPLDPSVKGEAESIAKSLLNKPLGFETTITLSNGKTYLARMERHSNKPKGISLYEHVGPSVSKPTAPVAPATKQQQVATTAPPPITPKTKSIMQKITDFINNLV